MIQSPTCMYQDSFISPHLFNRLIDIFPFHVFRKIVASSVKREEISLIFLMSVSKLRVDC